MKKIPAKVVKDVVLNGLASGILTLALQLAIYPFVARYFSASEYGKILLMIGIANIVTMSFGSTLNNVRLIQNSDYEARKMKADFNVIMISICIAGGIISAVFAFLFLNSITNILFFVSFVILGITREYYSVSYRLVLNFKGLLVCNGITACGYLTGLFLLNQTGIWTIVFFAGEAFGVVYLFLTTKMPKEPLIMSVLFKETLSKFALLFAGGIVGTLIMYLDRLVIYPVMGGAEVSIYVVASFFGKALSIAIGPVSGVFLSYFSQADFIISKHRFRQMTLLSIIVCAAFALISLPISPWLTGIFYPTLIADAKPYIFIANLAAIVSVSTGLIRPAILKFAPTKWQPPLQITYGVIYFGLGFAALKQFGLMGFCYAILIANVINFFVLYLLGEKTFR